MISRIWHGNTSKSNADPYEGLLRNEIFTWIDGQHIEGYRGIQLLRRELESEVEFITIMWFDSRKAVRDFAGEDEEACVVLPQARQLLAEFDLRSQHYDVRASSSITSSVPNTGICRIWHGFTTPEKADSFEALQIDTVIPWIAGKNIPGYQGIHLFRRNVGNEVEFITLMGFENLNAVKGFAGENYEECVTLPEDLALLAHYDSHSQHYDLRVNTWYFRPDPVGAESPRPGFLP